MKGLVFLILIVFCFGCELVNEECTLCDIEVGQMYDYKFDDSNINNYYNMPLDSVHMILAWVQHHITYDKSGGSYWPLPEETNITRKGHCVAFCLVFQYLIKEKLDIYSELVLIDNGNHVIVYIPSEKIGQQYIDVTAGIKYTEKGASNLDITWYCPYEEAIWMAYYYHDNVGQYY